MWDDFNILFPMYYEEKEWDVYVFCKSLLDHYSMVLLLPGHIEGFMVHLVVEERKTCFYMKHINLRKYRSQNKDLTCKNDCTFLCMFFFIFNMFELIPIKFGSFSNF